MSMTDILLLSYPNFCCKVDRLKEGRRIEGEKKRELDGTTSPRSSRKVRCGNFSGNSNRHFNHCS